MKKFIYYIQIPIRVSAYYQQPEPTTPGADGGMGIDDIEICTYDEQPAENLSKLKDDILVKYNDDLIEQAWEQADEQWEP